MNYYKCTNPHCDRVFDNFPAANNHEKATEYRHLTYSVTYGTSLSELIVCSCGCGEVVHATEAIWDADRDIPFVSESHRMESFYELYAR